MPTKTTAHISAGACLSAALMILILPLPWLLAAVLAALFHELCHYLALRLCGARVRRIGIGITGTVMEAESLGAGRELLCALAGPVGGLLLLLFLRWIPRIALCAGVHSLYNLLPLYPLDGGRALHCGIRLLLPPRTAAALCRIAQWLCLACVSLLAAYASFVRGLGLIPIFAAGFLLLKQLGGKIPCKTSRLGVQ